MGRQAFMKILIVGCGYFGAELAAYTSRNGCDVYTTTRSPAKLELLQQLGTTPIQFDWHSASSSSRLPEVDKVFISVSHYVAEGLDPTRAHVDGLRALFDALPDSWRRCVYLSTTGVFKPHLETDWVDEQSPTGPVRPGSIAALAGEQWCAENFSIDRMTIMRPAGIYGPGRVPNLQSLQSGIPLAVDPNSYLNLIHVSDLAKIAFELSEHKCKHSVYCVSDGNPILRRDYYGAICQLKGWPQPVFESTTPEDARKSTRRGQDNKRISNRRLIEELNYQFLFPSFREGLFPLLQND